MPRIKTSELIVMTDKIMTLALKDKKSFIQLLSLLLYQAVEEGNVHSAASMLVALRLLKNLEYSEEVMKDGKFVQTMTELGDEVKKLHAEFQADQLRKANTSDPTLN